MKSKIVEKNRAGEVIAEYDTLQEAAEVRGINKGTVLYSIEHPGHILRRTQTAFYRVSVELDPCSRCRFREKYSVPGGVVIGCGYYLKTGQLRGCKIKDCEKWKE